ncbi:helix-turn-helix transcriptional regulator [Yoonia sp. I 8.24]|uniref:helix-turn-helix transcriptional regulator n=1 Tax=Yoonia sp. I 8.24 TaxID=1537229 RepID=UPI001EDD71B6|nr:helix-turn-helix transcriptional regulator [Yoonia sp. I 8.24]MCG3267758.1 helix-turn-helix transcriptional regulator [Yoonia sp. I 8.24]
MTKTFRDALVEMLEQTKMSVAELARVSGVSKDQLNKLRQRETAKTNVEDARKIAAAFGKTLDNFIGHPISKEDVDLAKTLSQLEPSEREFLLNAAKAQIAARGQARKQSDKDSQ